MIGLLEQFELAFGNLPKDLKSNQVIYVENNLNPELKLFLEDNLWNIKNIFRENGLEFVYLTGLIDHISDDYFQKRAKFYIPWLKPEDMDALRKACLISIEDLQKKLTPKDADGAVIDGEGQVFKIDVSDPMLFEYQFRRIAEAYGKKKEDVIPPYHIACDEDADYNISSERRPSRRIAPTGEDELTRLFRRVREIVPDCDLRQMLVDRLYQEEVISRVVIGYQSKITLPDYNISIRLSPVEMTFYILFLRHPEGIQLTHLANYRKELLRYYRRYSVNSNDNYEEAIDNLVNTLENGTANTNRTRIKQKINNAFRSAFFEKYARYYMISGEQGEPKKILLPRDKVVWEIDL